MYLKISTSDKNLTDLPIIFSSKLTEDQRIMNIEVIDENKLLILIEESNNIKGAIYDINNNQIINFIQR